MTEYCVSTNPEEFDFELIYDFISQSYWAKGIPRETLAKSLDNSLCFAVLNQNKEQVGFARVITDKATFGYLADVFIVQAERGKGLSKLLMSAIMEHSELQGLRRFMLATKDAHTLYQQFGFKQLDDADRIMQIRNPNVYQR